VEMEWSAAETGEARQSDRMRAERREREVWSGLREGFLEEAVWGSDDAAVSVRAAAARKRRCFKKHLHLQVKDLHAAVEEQEEEEEEEEEEEGACEECEEEEVGLGCGRGSGKSGRAASAKLVRLHADAAAGSVVASPRGFSASEAHARGASASEAHARGASVEKVLDNSKIGTFRGNTNAGICVFKSMPWYVPK